MKKNVIVTISLRVESAEAGALMEEVADHRLRNLSDGHRDAGYVHLDTADILTIAASEELD